MERTNIKIEFNIFADFMDLNNVTKLMGINPTVSHLKGDFIRNKTLTWKETLWAIETPYVETMDIEDVLLHVYGLIADKSKNVNEIKELYGAEVSIVFVVKVKNEDTPALSVNKDFIKFAGSIGARLDYLLYVY